MAGPDSEAELKTTLQNLEFGLGEEDIRFLLENGEKCIGRPQLLSKRFGISSEKAEIIVEIITKFTRTPVQITKEDAMKIDQSLQDDPSINTPWELCFALKIKEKTVADYLASKKEPKNVKVGGHRLHFSEKEGKTILLIISKYFPNATEEDIRKSIINNDLNMKEKLICEMKKTNPIEYSQLVAYLAKFKNSKKFEEVDTNLTFDDMKYINASNHNVLEVRQKLNKVDTVIREFIERFSPEEVEVSGYIKLQCEEVTETVKKFGRSTNSFHAYRMMALDTIKDMRDPSKIFCRWGNNPMEMFDRLLPWIFYYLKCYLPLDSIVTIVYDKFQIHLTTHQVFHMVFQHSDSLLRGFCIEHYSYSNPVPLYYPTFVTINNQECVFEVCKELWYSIRENRGLVSFGLGQAAFGRFGKSYLLDSIFETNFAEGNPRKSPFHFKSIDIQMTNNLYAADINECTKWAFIDCNGYVGSDVIHVICQQLEIAIIHVSYHDYVQNRKQIMTAIHKFDYLKYIYVFIRDFYKESINIDVYEKRTHIFIPNIIQHGSVIFLTILKKIGYEILHLPTIPRIGRNFIENIVSKLKTPGITEIQKDRQLVNGIMERIRNRINFSKMLSYSFLHFYPIFIQYMSFYYSALNETNREKITEYNENRVSLKDELDTIEISEIVQYLNMILERKNSVLILWKLSQDLSALTDEVNRNKNMSEDTNTSINDRYNLEILWREALLSYKYGKKDSDIYEKFKGDFAMNFSNYVERGEAFELIDGDNLRYFNKEINALLSQLYIKQTTKIKNNNKRSKIKMKQAPIVVSIFGPQSSGKSTLLNYCFGCKFLTSAGRCTRGVYASLVKLSTPVNCSDQFLILDTEGLDAVERGNSIKHFDRTMVLFCLAVSQVVIVNISSDIGEQMQNLLQICACSLLKLKVSKVAAPKVFFVLNQQVDPDKKKHIKSINILLKKLGEQSEFMETEGRSLSELINVSKENLFILPSAFNSTQINTPTANLFDSKVTKQSPTEDFANSCADLRLAIIDSLRNLPQNERPPFETMSEWMEMSGVIWEIIVKYQDIVKHRNIQEMKCYNILNKENTNLIRKHITDHKEELVTIKAKIINDIEEIETTFRQNIILQEKMKLFDEVYDTYRDACYTDFNRFCHFENLVTETNYICVCMKSNLEKLLDIERNYYKDEIQKFIRACWYDQNISDLRATLIEAINKNIDINLDLDEGQLIQEYETIWLEWSNQDLKEEEENERNKDFDDLYTLFKMESKMVENKQVIFELFDHSKFKMDNVIRDLESKIKTKFETYETSFSSEEDYIYPWRENNQPLKNMIPYTGNSECEYIRQDSLFVTRGGEYLNSNLVIEIKDWIPRDCTDLIQSCSGFYNHADITWKHEEWLQIKKLASCLKYPDNPEISTWSKLVRFISSNIERLLKQNVQVTVREIIHFLCSTFKHVNHEINYIQANLTNKAEINITTLAFAHVFKHRREMKMEKVNDYYLKKEKQKLVNRKFFLEQVNNRKLARGNWDRIEMRVNDEKNANRFALDFLERVKRGTLNDEAQFILNKLEERKENFSHKTLMLFLDNSITQELNNHPQEVTCTSSIVIQHICNRNEIMKILFNLKWEETVDKVYRDWIDYLDYMFHGRLSEIKSALTTLLGQLSTSTDKEIMFDSDSNFELANPETYTYPVSNPNLRESPLRAVTLYLKMYIDPNVTPEMFKTFFENTFTVDGIEMSKNTKNWKLCDKPNNLDYIVSKKTFNMLTNTRMFHSENIFNIPRYVEKLLFWLNQGEFVLTKTEFQEIVLSTRDKYLGQAVSCPERCPSCGKFCDKNIGHEGKCQITTGHQICSMGGKVWRNNDEKTAVLITCDDYRESTVVKIPGRKLKWEEFKDQTLGWDWDIPKDENYLILQENTRKQMQLIWNKYGREILEYYSKMGINIRYIPYTSHEDVLRDALDLLDYRICFVIDGTGSMRDDIVGARISVSQLISKYRKEGHSCKFAVVIYRDHCDGKDLLDKFPVDCKFTSDHRSVQKFLGQLKVFGGGDGPEAVLDGLATAINNFTSSDDARIEHKIVHIFDAPPHGNFPDYKSHSKMSDKGNCCCCNQGGLCKFDWRGDVWDKMRDLKIEYHGINTGKEFPEFTATMEENLKAQFGSVQEVDKTLVNEAVFHIFIDIVT